MFKKSTSMKKVWFLVLGLFTTHLIYSQRIAPFPYNSGFPINYIRAWQSKAPQSDATKIKLSCSTDSFLVSTRYLDGLGREVQSVARAFTPGGRDLVNPTIYNDHGAVEVSYLSFEANATGGNISISDGGFKANAFQQDSTFYKALFPDENFIYSLTNYEAPPLGRRVESFAEGASWAGTVIQSNPINRKSIKTEYLINTFSDSVRIWNIEEFVGAVPASSQCYGPGQLYKNITTDENQNKIVEFRDKSERLILRKLQTIVNPSTGHYGWLCTYYVYDDWGNLRFVLPPKAVEALSSWTVTTAIRDELCFYYGYDSRNRITVKKIPGAGEVYMVYDERDRLVMMQDAKLRTTSDWRITLYNERNQPVETGFVNNAQIGSKPFATHQSDASASSAYPFALSSPPSSGYEVLTQTGYDNYSSLPSGAPSGALDNTVINSTNFITTYNATPYFAQPLSQSIQTVGMVTWTKVKVLGTTSMYLYTTLIYDDKGRVIQTKSSNISGGVDVSTTQVDFSGKVLRSHVVHQKAGTNAETYQVLTKNSYDAVGRLLSIKKAARAGSASYHGDKTIATYAYNELGQLKTKKVAADYDGGAGLENQVFDYNIRGWLLGVNRDDAKVPNNGSSFFSYDLGYDKTSLATNVANIGSYAEAQYNGNIAGTVWKSRGDGEIRKYDFSYDAVNRLTGADFNQYTGGFNKLAGLDFTVNNLTYDANGNILTMDQKGWKFGGSVTVDALTYSYASNSNKLTSVLDASNDATTRLGDFRSSSLYMSALGTKTTAAVDYEYDENGNLKKDRNKDIETYGGGDGIEYNFLNLPKKITVKASGSANKGTIEYTYDATGNKLKKVTTEGSTVTTTLYMFGNYVNDELQYLPHEEGRLRRNVGNTGFEYDYFLKDHLGNIRTVLTEEQRSDMYPPATMEAANASVEDAIYGNLDLTRIDIDKVPHYPTDNYTTPNYQVAKLLAENQKIGPYTTLKVMAGDKVNIYVSSWYESNNLSGSYDYILNSLWESLSGGISALGGGKVTQTQLNTSGSPVRTGAVQFLDEQAYNWDNTRPMAYVSWILFDEQFKYVQSSSGSEQVGDDGVLTTHTLSDLPIHKNGYLFVFVSNASTTQPVYFDNLQVTHVRGPLLEENHYYPFGLTMSAISTRAVNFVEAVNKKKFNAGSEIENSEFSNGDGLELYSTFYRRLDPQIGRWLQIDPKPTYAETPYSSMANNPITFNDPLGDIIRIRFRTGFLGIFGRRVNLTYDAGNRRWNNADGTAYAGKTTKFSRMVTNDLARIQANPMGNHVVTELANAAINYNIRNGDPNSNRRDNNNIYYSGSSNSSDRILEGNLPGSSPSQITLGHELWHKYSRDNVGIVNNLWFGEGENRRGVDEYAAMRFENELRATDGLPRRVAYQTAEGGALQGRVLNDAGGIAPLPADLQVQLPRLRINPILNPLFR